MAAFERRNGSCRLRVGCSETRGLNGSSFALGWRRLDRRRKSLSRPTRRCVQTMIVVYSVNTRDETDFQTRNFVYNLRVILSNDLDYLATNLARSFPTTNVLGPFLATYISRMIADERYNILSGHGRICRILSFSQRGHDYVTEKDVDNQQIKILNVSKRLPPCRIDDADRRY